MSRLPAQWLRSYIGYSDEIRECDKMQNSVNSVLGEDAIQLRPIPQITALEKPPLNSPFICCGEFVAGSDLRSSLRQRIRRMTVDVSHEPQPRSS